jgi:hypothetical protein
MLLDFAALQSDLARYDIPAKVTVGSFCSSDPMPGGFSQVVSGPSSGQSTARAGSGGELTMTFDGSAMPAGTELSFGNFQLSSGQQQADITLINTSSSSCTSTPPTLGPDTPGFGLLYGGHGRDGS